MDKKVIDLYGRNQNVDNINNYAKALQEFIEPFMGSFPEDYFIEEVYDFAVLVWNSYNLDKEFPDGEGKLFDPSLINTQPEKSIYEKMMRYKKKKFDRLDQFIINLEVTPLNNKKLQVDLSVVDGEFFLKSILDEQAHYLQDISEAEEGYVNRCALILIPKKPFFDWLNSHEDSGETITIEEPYVYLVDDEIEDWKAWLPKAYKPFFEEVLFGWYLDEDYWPKKRTYALFKDWFTIHFSDMVWDSVPEPIVKGF